MLRLKDCDFASRPGLIIGKGPSFKAVGELELSDYISLTLNSAIDGVEGSVDYAHFIDLEAFLTSAPAVKAKASRLIMPWHPHKNFTATKMTLADHARDHPELAGLIEADRVVCYNKANDRKLDKLPGHEELWVSYFSAEAAVQIFAKAGGKRLFSAGVDGGSAYAPDFDDSTLLSNGRPSFDIQFGNIAETIRRHKMDYRPLLQDQPVKVFVGADPTQALPAKVLEYSIRKHSDVDLHFEMIDNSGIDVSTEEAIRPRTGFSFARFKIPALCNYESRAIYLDADMQVFNDISFLWSFPMGDNHLVYSELSEGGKRIPQYSVILMDCSKLRWDANQIVAGLADGTYNYAGLMYDFCIVDEDRKNSWLPFEWNSLETFVEGETSLIHYTDMHTQPWVTQQNKNYSVWLAYLREAVESGFLTKEFFYEEVGKGHVNPDLLVEVGLEPHPNVSSEGWEAPYVKLMPKKKKKGIKRLIQKWFG